MRRAVLVLCFVFAGRAWAGEIVLKNGDRLTGRIIRMDKATIEFETELFGKVSLPWNAVVKIQSDTPLYVGIAENQYVVGKIALRDDRVEIRSRTGDAVAYRKDAIHAMRTEDEQRAFLSKPRPKTPGLFDLWGGSLDAAISATRGNSESETLNFGLRAARVSPRDKAGFYFISIFSDSGRGTARFANTWRGGSRYDVNIGKRFFTFGFTDIEHDQFQSLDLRLVGGGGLGLNVVKHPKMTFQVFSGGSANHESFHNSVERQSREFVLGNDFTRQVNRNVSVAETLIVYPNLSSRGQYRVNFDSSIVTRLNNWLGWQVTLSSRYVSNPAAGRKNNDLLMTTGIRFMHRPDSAQNIEARPELRRK
jgi:putative salt-induced outer membrane protein YdiY